MAQQGGVGVVADCGEVCLVGVDRLHLDSTEPFDDYRTVEDARRLVHCGVSSLSHVPTMQLLLRLCCDLPALPPGGTWESKCDDALVAEKGAHRLTFASMQHLAEALSQDHTLCVCIYVPHEPYNGWVAGSHGIMRPLWAIAEEGGAPLTQETPTTSAVASTLCAIAGDTDLQAQLDTCQRIITQVFQIRGIQTQHVYIDTSLLSLAILGSGHPLHKAWLGTDGGCGGKWVFMRLRDHQIVVVCLYEYHKTILDLLAVCPAAECMEEHATFVLDRAKVLQTCARRRRQQLPSDPLAGIVTIDTPTNQHAWEWSARPIVDPDRDKPLTWGYLADEMHIVHVARTPWGDVRVRNPDGLHRWGSGLHTPIVWSAIMVGDHWYDIQRAESVFAAVWDTQQQYSTPQKLRASFTKRLTKSNQSSSRHDCALTIEQLAYFLQQPVLCISHQSSRLDCMWYNPAVEQEPIIVYLCCAMLCHKTRKRSNGLLSAALSAEYTNLI